MKLALWQTEPFHDPAQGLDALDHTAQRARAMGADLLLTPEMVLGGYNIGAAPCQDLATRADTLIFALKSIAQKHEIALVAGLALPGADKPFNGAIALDKTGAEQQRYHKTHLFGEVDRSQFSPGDVLSGVFQLAGWSVGLAICYDIEFPEVARALRDQGADLILVPTANMIPFDSVATRLVPARAEENAVYVGYANYIGTEGAFTYGGLSCICGPDGDDLARASRSAPDLILAQLDRALLTAHRRVQTHLSDRRLDLYQPPKTKGHSHE